VGILIEALSWRGTVMLVLFASTASGCCLDYLVAEADESVCSMVLDARGCSDDIEHRVFALKRGQELPLCGTRFPKDSMYYWVLLPDGSSGYVLFALGKTKVERRDCDITLGGMKEMWQCLW